MCIANFSWSMGKWRCPIIYVCICVSSIVCDANYSDGWGACRTLEIDRRPSYIRCVERIAQSDTLFLTKHTRCPDTLGVSQVRSRDRVPDREFLSIYGKKYISKGSGLRVRGAAVACWRDAQMKYQRWGNATISDETPRVKDYLHSATETLW